MRIPRNLSGADLAESPRVLGYRVTRQAGSHMRPAGISTRKSFSTAFSDSLDMAAVTSTPERCYAEVGFRRTCAGRPLSNSPPLRQGRGLLYGFAQGWVGEHFAASLSSRGAMIQWRLLLTPNTYGG